MAHGNAKAMRAYVNKVFDLETALGGLKDARREPTVPFAFLLVTWFWACVKRLPSTEQVGRMLGDRRWQKRMGIEKLGAGSADTAARVLDGLDIDEMNASLLDVFFKARRAGILSSGGPQGPPLRHD